MQLSRIALLEHDVAQAAHFAHVALDAVPRTASMRSRRLTMDQVQHLVAVDERAIACAPPSTAACEAVEAADTGSTRYAEFGRVSQR